MNNYTGLEIAVVGISCRFPGAKDWRAYWDNLVNERESIHHYSREELLQLDYPAEFVDRANYVTAEASIDNKDLFDASFFGYTPTEAGFLNPVHRLFQECAWGAIEDAGLNLATAEQLVGVFGSASTNLAWPIHSMLRNKEGLIDNFSLDKLISKDFMSTLLSYKLDLKGTSLFIDTGCSSSLVAIINASKHLLLGDIDVALAGSVTVAQKDEVGYTYNENSILSSDGHCRAFDRDADGTVGSEGAAVIVLKRLKDAIRDKDNIYCTIKGGATNNDGKRKVGYSAPSIQGQAECITRALKFARVNPERVSYIETHGTATRLGDPIEINALKLAYKDLATGSCAIGSVKTNIGHTWATSGIAGLIKVALGLKHRILPASLHYKNPNPEINFAATPFYVNTSTQSWINKGEHPLCAGVSSFGIGGTNAHILLEEYITEPSDEDSADSIQYNLVPLSARSKRSVVSYAGRLKAFVEENRIEMSRLAYTFQQGRSEFNFREIIVFQNKKELLEKLNKIQDDSNIAKTNGLFDALVFMFSGSGSQYFNMGLGLYNNIPVFKEEMDKGFTLLHALTGEDYHSYIYGSAGIHINDVDKLQVIIFLFDYSLARLLISCGIKPSYMIGHSLGEYVCACLSGIFKFEDALKLIVQRGKLLKQLGKGSMLSVAISPTDASKFLLENKISLAAINTGNNVVFSGDSDAINALKYTFDQLKISSSVLFVDRAMHSYMIDLITGKFKECLEAVEMHLPTIPFISNVTGQLITNNEANSPDYWTRHFREQVRFADGIKCLHNINTDFTYVEVGAGDHLSNFVRQNIFLNGQLKCVGMVRHVKENKDDTRVLLNAMGNLWKQGVHVDWKNIYRTTFTKMSLPTYWFDYVTIPASVNLSKALAGTGTENSRQSGLAVALSNRVNETRVEVETGSLIETEEKLIRIFETFFGIEQISSGYSFFELGGDSLKAVNIIKDIEIAFNQRLSISILYDSANLKELAKLIHVEMRQQPETLPDVDSEIYTFIENKRNQRKVFFFPPVVGNPVFFKPLVDKLNGSVDAYGFYYRGIRESEPLHSTIKQMAKDYAVEVLRRADGEEVVLFAFSMGTLIAFEVARILEFQGVKLTLILIDKAVNVNDEIPEDINFIEFTPEIDRIYLEILLSDVNINEKRLKKYLLNNHRMVNTNVISEVIASDIYAFECTEGNVVDMKAWKQQTRGRFNHTYISGLHWQALNDDKLDIYIALLDHIFLKQNNASELIS